jgi:hypothetical protein
MRLGPIGLLLTLHQIRVVPKPKQLQLSLQLREVLQDGGQCQPGPLMDPTFNCHIDATLDQI